MRTAGAARGRPPPAAPAPLDPAHRDQRLAQISLGRSAARVCSTSFVLRAPAALRLTKSSPQSSIAAEAVMSLDAPAGRALLGRQAAAAAQRAAAHAGKRQPILQDGSCDKSLHLSIKSIENFIEGSCRVASMQSNQTEMRRAMRHRRRRFPPAPIHHSNRPRRHAHYSSI